MNASDELVASFAALKKSVDAGEENAFQLELHSMEEIYRAAGVVSPQQGYSVHKVAETLRSDAIRGLSTEMKRIAVLMALDAAGVTIEQIQADAKSRQEALDRYEAEQRRVVEEEWVRRAEETKHIQMELEQIKAYYAARMNRNQQRAARERSTFNAWLEQKRREAKAIAGVQDLCVKTALTKPTSTPATKARARAKASGA
jgi:hypothetical protein